MENELALKVDNVKKRYRLGVIGGGTLQGDIQSWWARVRGKEDPNTKIGTTTDTKKGSFMALDGISFEVKKGERLGIIGGNGAGKSTTLKILSRVTAPTEGTVYINGRISSMLEVGTGFHPELTGRENIYLNGAILGMNKEEVDRKIEDIIDFSECRQFIDTPVKRYSSGMYVKLAFSVAAHLDSEILIMDEVLAVGDMKFQQKCLDKMQEVSINEGRTILYVSHNMGTIRKLCDRCIVLNKGKMVFDGDVEKAIEVYLGESKEISIVNECNKERMGYELDEAIRFEKVTFLNKEYPVFLPDEDILLEIEFTGKQKFSNMAIRMVIQAPDRTGVGLATTNSCISVEIGKQLVKVSLKHDWLAPGKYSVKLIAYSINEYGNGPLHDVVEDAFVFETVDSVDGNNHMGWNHNVWGYMKMPRIEICE